MLEHKCKGILSLNLKKFANPVNESKINVIVQNEMLLMLFCKRVFKQREDIQQNGKTIKNSFWKQYVQQFSVQIAYLKIFDALMNYSKRKRISL